VTGGVLLVLSAAVGVAAAHAPWGASVKDWLFLAAVVVLVIGIGRAGSVTARRPIGSTATILLAIAPLTQSFWFGLMPVTDNPHAAEDVSALFGLTYYGALFVLAVIAVVSIVLADALPSGWRWAPLVVPAWTPLSVGLGMMLFGATPLGTAFAGLGAIIGFHGPAGGVAFLGIAAIVLGIRARPGADLDGRRLSERTERP
jgi:hypothetical protein